MCGVYSVQLKASVVPTATMAAASATTTISDAILPMSSLDNSDIYGKHEWKLGEPRVFNITSSEFDWQCSEKLGRMLMPKEIPDKRSDDEHVLRYILGPSLARDFDNITWTLDANNVFNLMCIKGTLSNGASIRMLIMPHMYRLQVSVYNIDGNRDKSVGGSETNYGELKEIVDEWVQSMS